MGNFYSHRAADRSTVAPAARVGADGTVRLGRSIVGTIDASGTFWRRVRDRHVLRSPHGIALHVELLDALAVAGVQAVAFEMDDGVLLTAPLSVYADRGIAIDRGAGAQTAVLLADFLRVEVKVGTPEDARRFLAGLTW